MAIAMRSAAKRMRTARVGQIPSSPSQTLFMADDKLYYPQLELTMTCKYFLVALNEC